MLDIKWVIDSQKSWPYDSKIMKPKQRSTKTLSHIILTKGFFEVAFVSHFMAQVAQVI